jgi:hypothetical protein
MPAASGSSLPLNHRQVLYKIYGFVNRKEEYMIENAYIFISWGKLQYLTIYG